LRPLICCARGQLPPSAPPLLRHWAILFQWRYEYIYSPIRQTQTEKYRYIQKDTILDISLGSVSVFEVGVGFLRFFWYFEVQCAECSNTVQKASSVGLKLSVLHAIMRSDISSV